MLTVRNGLMIDCVNMKLAFSVSHQPLMMEAKTVSEMLDAEMAYHLRRLHS
jgi:hypothetical protein